MLTRSLNILLVDDDDTTNFLHTLTLQASGVPHTLNVVETVPDALAIFQNQTTPATQLPHLVFLDLNLPGHTGFDFLDEYRKLAKDTATKPVIVVLSASVNHEDEKKALQAPEVAAFRSKPLSVAMVHQIISTYFPDLGTA